MNLSDIQINDLAKPLVSIIMEYYADHKTEEDFQRWLLNVEKNAANQE